MKTTGRPIGTRLRQLAGHPDSSRVAEVAEAHWVAIQHALTPIIGAQGVASLYRRSLYLARAAHPFLAGAASIDSSPQPFEPLRRALALQSSIEAAAAQDALLQIFGDLLINLIGGALTERLLGAVWDEPPPGGPAEEDI